MGTLCIFFKFQIDLAKLGKTWGGGGSYKGVSKMGGGSERSFVSCVYYNFAWWSDTLG